MYFSDENCETNWGKKIDLMKNVEAWRSVAYECEIVFNYLNPYAIGG